MHESTTSWRHRSTCAGPARQPTRIRPLDGHVAVGGVAPLQLVGFRPSHEESLSALSNSKFQYPQGKLPSFLSLEKTRKNPSPLPFCLSRSLVSPREERGRRAAAGGGGDMATKASSAASGSAYEEQRRKRVLENLKHLEVSTLVSLPLRGGLRISP